MELLRYYQKVASKTSWLYVILHPMKLHDELEVIKFLSEKFGTYYQYELWIQHSHLQSYSAIVVMKGDYDSGKGRNYQIATKKIFGAI